MVAEPESMAALAARVLRLRWGKDVLGALADGPLRVSAIQSKLAMLGRGTVHPKVLHSAIQRLSRDGLLTVTYGTPRATTCALTPAGRRMLERLDVMNDRRQIESALESRSRMSLDDFHDAHGINTATPSAARVYDFFLGGTHNFDADRTFAEQVRELLPWVPDVAGMNRAFLRRVVNYLLDQGIRQFLDLGSGIPTAGNVHQIAHERHADARVVYVDREPAAYLHARTWLADTPNATIIKADIRYPDAILQQPEIRLLDFSRPVGLLMVGVLLFIAPEDRPGDLVAAYRQLLAPGSYLAISHIAAEEASASQRAEVDQLVAAYETAEPVYVRTRAEISSWFDGMVVIPPGITPLPDWRPDHADQFARVRDLGYCGVGIQP